MSESSTPEPLKPARLRPGATIGVISPAGPLDETRLARLENGIAYLRRLGYEIIEGRFLRAQTGYLAGTDEQRAADLNDMLNNPAVQAIFCARGGYGISRLLDRIDYAAAARSPKIIVGYSDITALSLALWEKARLVTFSGPMVAIELHDIAPLTEKSLWDTLTGQTPTLLSAAIGDNPWRTISPGQAEGRLLGGCLSVLVSLLGTPFCPDFTGAILLLEDIGEDVYKIDRCLSQLKNAGILNRLAGVALGQFVDFKPDIYNNPIEFDEIIPYFFAPLNIPVISNFPYGHVPVKYTLPIGCRARLDASAGSLLILESGVQ